MKTQNILIFVIALVSLLALSGCMGIGEPANPSISPSGNGGRTGFENVPSASPSASAPLAPGISLPSNLVDSSGKMVVKTGDTEIEVKSGQLDAKLAELKTIIKTSGGTIDSVSF